MSTLRKITFALLALTVMFGAFGGAARPVQAAACTQYHYVRSGETLFLIGLYYGVTWDKLAEWNNLSNPGKIYAGQRLCVAMGSGTTPPANPPSWVPTFQIVSVVRDQTVTIRTNNFPANDTFNVRISRMKKQGINGTLVDTITTGAGGSQTYTFNIPATMAGAYRLAIRLESPTSGYYSYNWFYNNATTGGAPIGAPGVGYPYYSGVPTFSITSVVANNAVQLRTSNFPANVQFDVLMGPMGTRGINGYKVGSFNSGNGGAMTLTFNLPPELYNHSQIAIRTQSYATGYYSYNWFWNNTYP